MPANLICPRCKGSMVRGVSKGTFSGWRADGMTGVTQTVKYMCEDCGYIEERAVTAKNLRRSFRYSNDRIAED